MNRLSLYVARLFTRDSVALLAVMLGLLFLIQTLKIFDVVTAQGQDIFTLIGQSALSMPPLAIVLAYVCMGIGMVRVFGGLQATHELHIVHVSRLVGPLLAGVGLFAVGGAVVALLLSNLIEPLASKKLEDWSAAVAADVVGRTLQPHHFGQVVPNITVEINGRSGAGNISGFFADDRRDPTMRRTYSASTATLGRNGDGYVLELHDGTLQYLSDKGDFSQIVFKNYELALSRLTQANGSDAGFGQKTTPELLTLGASGGWPSPLLHELSDRLSEGLRPIAMSLFIAAIAGFPNARRRRGRFPLELVPLLVAYVDKTVTANINTAAPWGPLQGPTVVLVAGAVLLGLRLRLHLPQPRRAASGMSPALAE